LVLRVASGSLPAAPTDQHSARCREARELGEREKARERERKRERERERVRRERERARDRENRLHSPFAPHAPIQRAI